MKILIIHNRYKLRGGEDAVFENEAELLTSKGHDVNIIEYSNNDIEGVMSQARSALNATLGFASRNHLENSIKIFSPDVVHVHNFFPEISPRVFWICKKLNVPVVWTLHNFRIFCANGLMFREGKICNKCLSGSALNAVIFKCYRGSMLGSLATTSMIFTHNLIGTWQKKVSRFIALNDFAKAQFVTLGLPEEKISVKPNFSPRLFPVNYGDRNGAIYVGRLSDEKGIKVLLEAWQHIKYPLKIIGGGPLESLVASYRNEYITSIGHISKAEVAREISLAQFMIVPSVWYENYPMSIVEAFSYGTPVLASNIGSLSSIVVDGVNGSLFEMGDPLDLAQKAKNLFSNPDKIKSMSEGALNYYSDNLSPAACAESLISIYTEVIDGG